ncbi:hypothetical protein CMQ_7288 [Grosmannia clavigera kw1407]|uniref:Uncharacterized protein n=1 Tax=Grosmannia clavigera (strain kw1407 / UAMH 11150) TaxID=655863 RepID=F0XP13_GROCL|nr:uncharacterized protein CMQ_7288 [Grosmannia clavigera kw1407]EFX00286.1 hypothetical protein CMQ_7288 [Grosmannia clavigera kw1407]
MCGGDILAQDCSDRFGALAVLSPLSETSPRSPAGQQGFSGSIVFFNDADHDCQLATHLRFSPSESLAGEQGCRLFVNIHEFGDLSTPHVCSGHSVGAIALWPESSLADRPVSARHVPVTRQLEQPLYLHVGHDRHGNNGIIGRRVTVCCASAEDGQMASTAVLAEGIVGYNSNL